MSSDLYRRNDATTVNHNIVNGQTVDIAQTVRGSSFYFAICAVMGFTALTTIGLSYLKPRTDRIFFYITAALNFTAFIAYFAMGSNLGWTPIDVEFQRSDPEVRGTNRAIFYARYIDWVITTPLLLMDLLLTVAMPWPTIIWVIFLDEVMIVTGLIGALVSTRYKFGFYAIGCAAMFGIFWELAVAGRKHAKTLGSDVHRVFMMTGVWTLFIWLLYPVAWGVSEGGNVIAPDSEAVFYGVLDFCAKPLFSAMLIWGHWGISPARLGLHIRDYGQSPHEVDEKHHEHDVSRQNNGQSNGISAGNGYSNAGQTTGDNLTDGYASGVTPAHNSATSRNPVPV